MNTNIQGQRLIVSFLVAVFVLSSTSLCAAADVWWMRGEGWRKFPNPLKTLYVQGVLDGLVFADKKVQGIEISYKTSLEHLVNSLDQFYADYKNEMIPVPFALKVISLELSGVPKSLANEELERLRQFFYEMKN